MDGLSELPHGCEPVLLDGDAEPNSRSSLFGRRHAVAGERCGSDLLHLLVAEAGRLRFSPSATRSGEAFSMAAADTPATRDAMSWVVAAAARAGLGGPFVPNELQYRRLPGDARWQEPRRFARYYTECVAILVLQGAVGFAVHGDHDRARVIDEWETEAGQAVLLRGWSPLGHRDPRPYCRIQSRSGPPPLVLVLRHNLAEPLGQPWLQKLTGFEAEEARLAPECRATATTG